MLGINNTELKKFPEAEKCFQKAINIYQILRKFEGLNECKIGLAKVKLNLNEYEVAKSLFQNSLLFSKSNHVPEAIVLNMVGLGKIYLAESNYDSSYFYLKSAYDSSLKINYALGTIDASKALNEYFFAKKDFEKAHYYLKKNYQIQDSIYTIENTLRIIDLQSQTEIDRKENLIDELNTQQKHYRNWMIFLALIVLLGSFVIYLFYKNAQIKERLNSKLLASNIELKHSQEQILKLQKYKESFLANITHELRTPLNAIKGIADLLAFNNTEDERKELLSGLKKIE